MVYRLTVSYLGTPFAGWQRQPNAETVQGRLEDALREVLGRRVDAIGAGRTDAGVHARGQIAHVELPTEAETGALIFGSNHYLPPEIRVLDAGWVREGFHARKSAIGKEYCYRMSRERIMSPLDSLSRVPVGEIDIESLRAGTGRLIGRHDFTAFALAGGSHGQPFRRIESAEWIEDGSDLELRIVGDGFLRGMVRSLVGTLLEVGQGRRSVGDLEALLTGRPRSEAGPTAPARGLTLESVLYESGWELD